MFGFGKNRARPVIGDARGIGSGYAMMPACFGPRQFGRATGWYHDVTTLLVRYATDRDLLGAYIPEPFRVAEDAELIVLCAANRHIDWLAGRSYNLIEVLAPVHFEGQVDRLRGFFTLVIWENLCDPILTGRELQGMPKIFADIADPQLTPAGWRVMAEHFGHKILEMNIGNLRQLSDDELQEYRAQTKENDHWMGWRFLPNVGGQGCSLNEATLFPIVQTLREAWSGEGRVDWQTLTWEQNPTQFYIVNALAGLPMIEYRGAMLLRGATNLDIEGNSPRVLR